MHVRDTFQTRDEQPADDFARPAFHLNATTPVYELLRKTTGWAVALALGLIPVVVIQTYRIARGADRAPALRHHDTDTPQGAGTSPQVLRYGGRVQPIEGHRHFGRGTGG